MPGFLSLCDGVWKLKKDLINPRGKKSCKHNFWKVFTWPKGTLFVVEPWEGNTKARIIRPSGCFDMQLLIEKNNWLEHLARELELVPANSYQTVLLYAREAHRRVNPDEILKELYRRGKVSLDDIQAVIRSLGAKS